MLRNLRKLNPELPRDPPPRLLPAVCVPAQWIAQITVIEMLIKQLFIFALSGSLLACAGAGKAPSSDDFEPSSGGSDCIFEGTIRDYRVLDESNLIVTASGSKKYHIELTRPAHGLRSTWQIGFSSPGRRICSGFSELIADDSFGPEAIRIRSIRRLVPEEYEDLLIRYGVKKPEIEQAREPEEVEGAEVEELD